MDKPNLLSKIKQVDTLSNDEKAYLVNLVNTKKKYGLVWEDKPEDVEEQLRTKLPVLKEVVERRILAKDLPQPEKQAPTKQATLFDNNNPDNNENKENNDNPSSPPNHILIEGDNLHALTALTFTHEGAIDVIYIDPPYNTGNKDFKYNDSFVDREDSYRHSKWLSFMHKRLQIAKRLLSDKGVIFISIDDNEHAQLKMLCDEVFSSQDFVSNIAVINNLKGRSDDKYIATAHENLIIFKKASFETLGVQVPDKYISEYKLKDERGLYRLQGLRKRGAGSLREDRPNMYYPFYYNSKEKSLSLEKTREEDIEILPKLSNGKDGRWRWGKETSEKRLNDLHVGFVKKRDEFDVMQKDYLHENEGKLKRIKPKSFWEGSEFSSDAGTKILKEIIVNNKFNNPKPLGLIN